jgi:hypothetical protein
MNFATSGEIREAALRAGRYAKLTARDRASVKSAATLLC